MWLSSGERLFYAGQSLWRTASRHWPVPADNPHPAEPGLFLVALLLFGYAIENGLKGLIVQSKARTSVRNEKGRLQHPLGTHKLCALAGAAGLQVSEQDRDLLVPGYKTSWEWAGRYPVMISVEGFCAGEMVPSASFHPVNDEPLIELAVRDAIVGHLQTRKDMRTSPARRVHVLVPAPGDKS